MRAVAALGLSVASACIAEPATTVTESEEAECGTPEDVCGWLDTWTPGAGLRLASTLSSPSVWWQEYCVDSAEEVLTDMAARQWPADVWSGVVENPGRWFDVVNDANVTLLRYPACALTDGFPGDLFDSHEYVKYSHEVSVRLDPAVPASTVGTLVIDLQFTWAGHNWVGGDYGAEALYDAHVSVEVDNVRWQFCRVHQGQFDDIPHPDAYRYAFDAASAILTMDIERGEDLPCALPEGFE